MDKGSKSPGSEKDVSTLSGRDISDFSKDELLAHIDALEMEISGKDGIIQSLQGDLSDSNDQIMNIPSNYRFRLETTITEQNLTIEALREELELRQKELHQLNEESFSYKDDATAKIVELNRELQLKKDEWEREKEKLKRILEIDKEAAQKHSKDLESKLDSEINRNLLLEKQVERLFNRLEELYQRDVEHIEELDFFRSQWEKGKESPPQAEKPFAEISPDYVESLRNQLAESLTKNAELELLLQSTDRTRQKELKKSQNEIESLSVQLDELKTMNSMLEMECKNAKILAEQGEDRHKAELCQLNEVLNELCKICQSSNPLEDSQSMDSGSTIKEDLSESASFVDLVNALHEKIGRCSSGIERYQDRLLEMDGENEILRKEIDLLSRDSEELGQYKEAVAHLRDELEKLKSRSNLVEKNYENSKLSLEKKLEALQNECGRLENEKHLVTKRLKDELNAVKSSYEELKTKCDRLPQLTSTYVQMAHTETQCDLPNPQNECLRCSEFTCLEVPEHSLSPVSKLTIPSDTTPPKSQSLPPFITSTPYHPGHLKGAGEPTQLDRSQHDLVKWMEKCQEFSVENVKLKNELAELKLQMKDLEVGAAGILDEQRLLESKRKELEAKVGDYIKLKQQCCQMAEKLKMNEYKISEMEEELNRANGLHEELRNENVNLESKFRELQCLKFDFAKAADASDTICNELSRKMSEVVLLKSKLETANQSNDSLLKKINRLAETKDLYVIRLEEATTELACCRAEIETLLDNNVKLAAANKSHAAEARSLKCRLDYLNELRERHWSRSESESLVAMMQKDMLALCHEAIEKKFECEKLLCVNRKAIQPPTELDARHRVELLMKDNGQLAHEKQDLLLAVSELQKILFDLQKESGCDEGWLQRIADFEKNLLREIKDSKEQHARIEEALRSTGNLHDELQMEKNDIKNKTIEIAKLEKKMENEKLRVEQLAMQLKLTIDDLNDKNEILKDIKEEKETLEADLASVKNALVTAESKLEWERQCNSLRLRHAELQNLSVKVLTNFSPSSEGEEQNYRLDLDYHKQVYEQVEAQYNHALQTMKHCLAKEFAQKALEDQTSHKEQIEKLKKIVEEQAAKIEKLTSSCIVDELTQEHQATPENLVIFENMDKCKKDINNAMASVANAADAAKIRTSFQEYFNHQILLAQKILQDEHRSQYSIAVSTLEQLHENELKLMKLKMEAVYARKLSEQSQDVKPSVSGAFAGKNLNESVPLFIFHVLRNTYFAKIESLSLGWSSAVSKKLENLENEIVKTLNVDEQLDNALKNKALACADGLLSDESALISSAQAFANAISGFKSDFLLGLKSALASLFDATKSTLETFEKENAQLKDVVTMREEMRKLENEKIELEKQCSAALQLLKSDHDTEVKKLDLILTELQHLNEIGCRADAILRVKDELEDKHKREVEELRTYFERKVADLEKNFSEEVFSQHSRKLSTGSSCFDDDSDRDKFATSSSFHCETTPFDGRKADLADLSDLFSANDDATKHKQKPPKRLVTEAQCADSFGCAAKVICRLVLDECQGDVEHELVEAVEKQELLEKFSARRKQVAIESGKDANELGATMVSHTIQKVGFECFKCLKSNIDADFVSRIANLESLMTDKLAHIQNSLISKCDKLDQLNRRLGKACSMLTKPAFGECDALQEASESSKEVAKLMKDRNNLEKMRNSLRAVVSELSQFLRNSENDLLKQIKDELLELCSDADDGRDFPESKTDKHVRFATNLSEIVHELDSTICESVLDGTVDSSTRFREDVHSCMRRLKSEAASLFKLSNQVVSNELDSNKLESEIEALREENAALQTEIARIKAASYADTGLEGETLGNDAEAVYGDVEETMESRPSNASYLQNKAKKFLQLIKDALVLKSLEDILREGDSAIDELQNRCEDLEQQVVLADKQLRSTRQFLEEQAIEREGERDEYSREIASLQLQLKEKDKECSSYIRFNSEVKAPGAQKSSPSSRKVDELNKELKDSAERLAESQEREQSLQTELKAAIDRVAVLRDIIRNLEGQISLRNHKETELRNKLDSLESEIQEKNGTQSIMAHEIEQLRNQSLEDSRGFEQLQALEENIKLKFNSSVIRQFQAQIKEMGKIVDHQTEELERNQVGGASSNSLSSPSEEISIREHIESFYRCKTPEHCPSPVCLPVDEVNKLNEKIVRHARADEVILKKLCDQEIRVDKLTKYAEEMHAERDELNKQKEKLKLQVVEAENKIDYLRHKADAANAAANRDIILENQNLKENLSDAEHSLAKLKHQIQEKDTQLESAEELIGSLQEKLRSLVQCDENALESLRLELVAMTAERNKLEGLVEKYKNDVAKYGSHPSELRALLSDKNDEIKLLQDTLSRYQDESGKHPSSRSLKGLRVSFAAETADSDSTSPDISRLRDCPGNDSFHFDDPSQLLPLKSSTQRDMEVSALPKSSFDHHGNISLPKVNENDEDDMNKLKCELLGKEEMIAKLEQRLADFQTMEQDLLAARNELQSAIAGISEDKNYYEEKLTSMIQEIKTKDERCALLEKSLGEKEREIEKLSIDVGKLRNLVSITQGKLSEAQGLAERDNVVSEVSQSQIVSFRKEIGRLTEENSKLESNIAKISTENDALCRRVADFMSENDSLLRKLSEIDSLKQSYDSRCTEMESNREILEKKLSELNVSNQKLKAELSRCESVKNHLEQTQDHLNSILKENESLQSTLGSLSSDFERLSFENRILKESVQSKTVDLQMEVEQLRQEVDRLSATVKTEKELKNELKKKCEMMSSELEAFKSDKRELSAEKETLAAENASLQKELDGFMTSVRNLRGELSSLKKKDTPYISVLASIDCDEVKKLYFEVSKLISDVGKLEFERNCLQQQLAKMRSPHEASRPEDEASRLSEQITRLELINAELKEDNRKHTKQLQAEIAKLAHEIKYLQTLEQQANDKLIASVDENQKLSSKLVELEKLMGRPEERCISEKGLQVSVLPQLRRTSTQIVEHIPEATPYHDEQVATASTSPTVLELDRAVESALYDKVRTIEELKNRLSSEESQTRALRLEKLDLDLNMKTMERINALQEKKLDMIGAKFKQLSNDHLRLELELQSEKTSRIHLENELKTAQTKKQSSQMENLDMLENMNSRLKLAMENEAKLKALVLEKHQQWEDAVAKFNGAMVMERYKTESENGGYSCSPQKRLGEAQEHCRFLQCELEKQERLNEDLKAVLSRERRTLLAAQERAKSLEAECNKLNADLRNEIVKRKELLQEQKDNLDHDKEEADNEQLVSLQLENDRLREKLEIFQELLDQRRAHSYSPALEQLKELSTNVESLGRRQRELQTVNRNLEEERDFLAGQIAQMREERTNMRLSSERMDFAPSVSAKLDIYLGRYFRAESYRKSLVSQKKYLTAVLRGFERSHSMTLTALVRGRNTPRQRPTFRGVVQTVIATTRMKFLVRKRKAACESAYIGLLRALGFTSDDAIARVGLPDSSAESRMHPVTSNSPPTKERPPSEASRRRRMPAVPHSQYLAALQEVQKLTR
ncbi:Pericentrin [Nesidiocoris tenuis]|uniref:Pericentrin n=1 Tax=Nesidiocoris tenuis TaxID=355587 RepID=A0ABN7A8Q2_9HEMI|nr:Pericentrin [Nesidiocoris tenuis]